MIKRNLENGRFIVKDISEYPGRLCLCGCGNLVNPKYTKGINRYIYYTKYIKGHMPKSEGYIDNAGYWAVYIPGRGIVRRHRLVMESLLDRKLKRCEHVHHKDKNKLNNEPENLELLTDKIHTSLHSRNFESDVKIKCIVCGAIFIVKRGDFLFRSRTKNIPEYCSKKCYGISRTKKYKGKVRE